jgi:hypothetical protein
VDEDEAPAGLSPRYREGDRALSRLLLQARVNPEGGYALACDSCKGWYSGPAWVPHNLYARLGPTGGSPEESECAHVLIHAPCAEKLWADIEKRYGHNAITGAVESHPDAIALSLPSVCADAKANWVAVPRLKPSEFKKQREELARRAEQLAQELERFYLPRDPDEHELPGMLDFAELMSQEELDQFDKAICITTFQIANRARVRAGLKCMDWGEYNDIGDEARALGYDHRDLFTPAREDALSVYGLVQRDHTLSGWPYGGVPTLPDMLRRIAKKFDEDGANPPIKNPNLGNAERNFFARFLCKYFWTSFGDVSPAIVRDIVSMFYAQGITEGDVSQMVGKIKKRHPLPPDP